MSNLPKVLIISGPTATGKTALAVRLSKLYGGELISADSRQVYIGLDIGVGKDHPPSTPIHLIDLVLPSSKFSAAQFKKLAFQKITQIHARGRLPIVVGCSGFYINSLLNSYSTFHVRPRPVLRWFLNRAPLNWLQLFLKKLDPPTFRTLNHSDLSNPYRLIRKIEIALSPARPSVALLPAYDFLHLSLTAPMEILKRRIDRRVADRINQGHLSELTSLLSRYRWSDPGLQVSAYACLRPYLEKKASLSESLAKWKIAEHRDAKHQATYLKKIKSAIYFDITRPAYPKNALLSVKKWYNLLNETHSS